MGIDKKINRIVASCKTSEQLIVAAKYILFAAKRGLICRTVGMYWFGIINGIAHAREWSKPQ